MFVHPLCTYENGPPQVRDSHVVTRKPNYEKPQTDEFLGKATAWLKEYVEKQYPESTLHFVWNAKLDIGIDRFPAFTISLRDLSDPSVQLDRKVPLPSRFWLFWPEKRKERAKLIETQRPWVTFDRSALDSAAADADTLFQFLRDVYEHLKNEGIGGLDEKSLKQKLKKQWKSVKEGIKTGKSLIPI